jgi:NAD(P)-dependent dehydrogenase (short-subunit alcohol dehydrogenase family)
LARGTPGDGLGGDLAQRFLFPLDLCSEAAISTGVEGAIKRFGRIDVLVNNAGHGLLGAVEEASDAEVVGVYETNVFGLLRHCTPKASVEGCG